MITLDVRTSDKTELIDITDKVRQAVRDSGVTEGVCLLYVPHTTAGISINENYDPTVEHDTLLILDELIPRRDSRYRHSEGNSDGHIKSALFGVNTFVFVSDGKLQLGRWQGVFFAEFDGPRSRRVWVSVLKEA